MTAETPTRGGKRTGAGRKAQYNNRVQIRFQIEKDLHDKLRAMPGINEKFNQWVQSILNEQVL